MSDEAKEEKLSSISASVRLRITLDVEVGGGSWGPTTTVNQIHRDARRSALGIISNMIQCGAKGGSRITQRGDPEVFFVTHETLKT